MTHKRAERPYKMCLAALAVGVAVLFSGAVFLRAGYPSDAAVLQVEKGDVSWLQGFTLRGNWRGAVNSAVSFSLENGSLTTVPQLRAEPALGIALWGKGELCVPENELAAVDGQAAGGAFGGVYGAYFLRNSYEGMQYTAQTTHLEQIYTLTVTDGSDYSVRISLGELETSSPVTVSAEICTEYRGWDDFPYRTAVEGVADIEIETRDVQILSAEEPISLYIGPGNGENGSIRQVRQFCTPEEVEQIVPDVMIHGMAVPSLTKPYGTVEEVYTLDDGECLAPCTDWNDARLDNGRWFLTKGEDGSLCLLLLDSNWQSVSKQPLGIHMTEGQRITVLPSMRNDEIVFTVTDAGGSGQAIVLRLENGQVQTQKEFSVAPGASLLTAGFSEDGAKLMTVTEKTEELAVLVPAFLREQHTAAPVADEEILCTNTAVTGWNVQVYPVEELSEPVFSGVLDFGITQQWARQTWLSGVYNMERKVFQFDVTGAWEYEKGEQA